VFQKYSPLPSATRRYSRLKICATQACRPYDRQPGRMHAQLRRSDLFVVNPSTKITEPRRGGLVGQKRQGKQICINSQNRPLLRSLEVSFHVSTERSLLRSCDCAKSACSLPLCVLCVFPSAIALATVNALKFRFLDEMRNRFAFQKSPVNIGDFACQPVKKSFSGMLFPRNIRLLLP
jgi:hypothetical protein